jgi:hypothetical protein
MEGRVTVALLVRIEAKAGQGSRRREVAQRWVADRRRRASTCPFLLSERIVIWGYYTRGRRLWPQRAAPTDRSTRHGRRCGRRADAARGLLISGILRTRGARNNVTNFREMFAKNSHALLPCRLCRWPDRLRVHVLKRLRASPQARPQSSKLSRHRRRAPA